MTIVVWFKIDLQSGRQVLTNAKLDSMPLNDGTWLEAFKYNSKDRQYVSIGSVWVNFNLVEAIEPVKVAEFQISNSDEHVIGRFGDARG